MDNMIYKNQEGMTQWMQNVTGKDSTLYQGGIVTLMEPSFVSCDFENKSATISFCVQDWQKNPGGTLHGGMLVTTMDTGFGVLCHYLAGEKTITTINIETTFLKPIYIGDTIHVTSHATHIGRTLVSMTCDVRIPQKNNLLVATGSATFMIFDSDSNRQFS